MLRIDIRKELLLLGFSKEMDFMLIGRVKNNSFQAILKKNVPQIDTNCISVFPKLVVILIAV